MLKSKKITVLLIIFLAVIFLLPDIVLAQVNNFGIDDLTSTSLGTNNLKDTIARIINVALGFLGILATLLILYGGWVWMMSKGSATEVDRAKKILLNAVIGLMIVLASYAIARFVLTTVYNATNGHNANNGGGGYHGGIGLGGGVIESHYPGRNATDIARNTNIYITFKEAINIDHLTTNVGCTAPITRCAHPTNLVLATSTPFTNADLAVEFDVEQKVFGFNPYGGSTINHLGNENGSTEYQIFLDGAIEKDDGEFAFSPSGYDWEFTVSNEIDLTPPTVTSVIPVGIDNARNSVVQINFSEAINPMFAAGVYDDVLPDFTYINIEKILPAPAEILKGTYRISNQYRTVEFLADIDPADLCGVNSCGGDVYCLPSSAKLIATVTDDIKDMADNQLDGDDNGTAGGDYDWTFETNNDIHLTPPIINKMDALHANVPVGSTIKVAFDESLLASSVNTANIDFVETPDIELNYWLELTNLSRTINIHHDILKPNTDYLPTLSSNILDTYQNCWYTCKCYDALGSCVCNPPQSGVDCPGIHCETP